MTTIDSAGILILATDGYERSELRVPLRPRAKGAEVKIASLEKRPIKSWDSRRDLCLWDLQQNSLYGKGASSDILRDPLQGVPHAAVQSPSARRTHRASR